VTSHPVFDSFVISTRLCFRSVGDTTPPLTMGISRATGRTRTIRPRWMPGPANAWPEIESPLTSLCKQNGRGVKVFSEAKERVPTQRAVKAGLDPSRQGPQDDLEGAVSLYADLEHFVQSHRHHGDLTWWTTQPTPKGYQVEVACPCGVTFERWVLPQDAEEDLLRSGLSAFEN